jgi:hypothetical protein
MNEQEPKFVRVWIETHLHTTGIDIFFVKLHTVTFYHPASPFYQLWQQSNQKKSNFFCIFTQTLIAIYNEP